MQVACVAPKLRDVTDGVNPVPVILKQLRGRVVAVQFVSTAATSCFMRGDAGDIHGNRSRVSEGADPFSRADANSMARRALLSPLFLP